MGMLDMPEHVRFDITQARTAFDDIEVEIIPIEGGDALPDSVPPVAAPSSNVKIYRAPGQRASSILSFVFAHKTFDAVFSQAILDMREEYLEALASEDLLKANWIVLRDHTCLGLSVFAYLGVTIGKKVSGIWKMIP
jgi:hypothetical protein